MSRPPPLALASLLLATFLVSLGYGVLLPVLPALVATLDPTAAPNDIVWHTGLVTAAYAGASLLAAPLWGRLADRSQKPYLMALSLALVGLATIAGSYAASLSTLYLWRAGAGIGAGMIGPATQAWLGRWSADGAWRTRRVVWISLASIAGLFVGPVAGGLTSAAGFRMVSLGDLGLRLPFIATGTLLLLSSLLVALMVPLAPAAREPDSSLGGLIWRIAPFLPPVGAVALSVGAFEVALAFMADGKRMALIEIALLFAQCTAFMFAAQSLLIVPRFRDHSLRPLIVPALGLLAVGLTATAFASGFVWHVLSTGLVAIGGGLLPPVLARDISVLDGGATGLANGIQSAAGQTAGAILASLIAVIAEPRGIFLAAAAAAVATGVFAVRFAISSPAPGLGQ
jgi:MFS family permease